MGYLSIADGQVGYRGDGYNHVKYWLDLAPSLNGQPWCGAFVSWCLWKDGQLAAIGGSPMYSCTAMMNKAKQRGQWASTPVDGCLAIFDFGSGSPAHVEFVVTSGSSTNVQIGGNTSGDLVAKKVRRHSDILGYWHIEATPGSIPPGSGGGSGPAMIGYGNFLAPPVPTIVGAPEDTDARFTTYRRAGFVS